MKHKKDLDTFFFKHKTTRLSGRHITYNHIKPLINGIRSHFDVVTEGFSVNKIPIHSITFGHGKRRILLWSQMHGNESTTTKAVFDLLHAVLYTKKDNHHLFNDCKVCVIPLLNPDGALVYSRLNANNIDLNRDAQKLSQPESLILRQVFNRFKPDYCFNLHGQRTIFSAGKTQNPATLSFLAPAVDKDKSLTASRKKAMQIIMHINTQMQHYIPKQIGRYDDVFNPNCVGDGFQQFGTPTILVEAGHYTNDYPREQTRKWVFMTLYYALNYISEKEIDGNQYEAYYDIPENKKQFFDIIFRNARLEDENETVDIAFQFDEILNNNNLEFLPKVVRLGKLNKYQGHKELDLNSQIVKTQTNTKITKGYSSNLIIINNEKLSLKFMFS